MQSYTEARHSVMILILFVLNNFIICVFMLFSGCFKSWSSVANTNTPGGISNVADSLYACKVACLMYNGCNGVDWTPSNTVGSQCYLSGSWNTGRNNGGATGTTHYDIVQTGSCTSGSRNRFCC